jgi:hypothetical protein
MTEKPLKNDFECRYVKQTISDLLQNKVDMSQLVITKALSKTGKFPMLYLSVGIVPTLTLGRCTRVSTA